MNIINVNCSEVNKEAKSDILDKVLNVAGIVNTIAVSVTAKLILDKFGIRGSNTFEKVCVWVGTSLISAAIVDKTGEVLGNDIKELGEAFDSVKE